MKYVLGLDIGSASVGWTVADLDRYRIEELGVRAFNAAEVKEGNKITPCAEPRRSARGARRRLRRRRGRLDRAQDLFLKYRLLSPEEVDTCFPECIPKHTAAQDPWKLRAQGLDHLLTGDQLARALYHMAKRRGFKSNRKQERPRDEESKKEETKMLGGISSMRRTLAEGAWRTVGEMLAHNEEDDRRKRNRDRDYSHTVERSMLEDEIRVLFQAQRTLGSHFASAEFEMEFLAEAFNWQLPFASGDAILRKVGLCTFEGKNGEIRAPRASYTTELSTLLQKINNVQIVNNGDRRPLSDEERRAVLDMAHSSKEVTYKQIRKRLDMPEEAWFAGIPFRYRGEPEEDRKREQKNKLPPFAAYHALSAALDPVGLWEDVKDNPDLLDHIAFALTFYKNEPDIRACLVDRNVPTPVVDVLSGDDAPTFSGVGKLSIKAMRNLMLHLKKGLRYDQACTAAGYSHYDPKGDCTRGGKLPPIDKQFISNPVVLRALSQARKVVNHIVARHGPPTYINIELARDTGKSAEKRKEIEKQNYRNRMAKEESDAHFRECFGADPKGEDRIKWQLYHEQGGQCAYSQRRIELTRLLEANYVEIDHILPWSRSFDNRFSNRVLVHSKENRDKKNSTPYEYFVEQLGDTERWADFKAFVTNIRDRDKKANLLTETFASTQDERMERSLTDTRYAAAFFSELVRHHLEFADPEEKQPVRCLAGGVTALARGLWGLGGEKEQRREEGNDLHHALDAAVIAMLTPGRIKFITDYVKAKEAGWVTEITDTETGEIYEVFRDKPFEFPPPWKHFRKELLACLSDDPSARIAELGLASYADAPDPRPVVVSRMPQRRMRNKYGSPRGPIHKDTIRSAKCEPERRTKVRKLLPDLKSTDLPNLAARDEDDKLYAVIQQRMSEFDNNPAQAFAQPLHKPLKDGSDGPVVRGVKVWQTLKAGVPVRDGIADNGRMIRTDVFRKQNKKGIWQYYLVPVYVNDVALRKLPNRAIASGKPEEEWPVMDESYEFLFSLYQYDLVRMKTDKGDGLYYYRGCHRGKGALKVSEVNVNSGEPQAIGARTAEIIEKFQMGVLGDYYPVSREVRCGLANDSDLEPGEAEG